jgi:hypothetical protein
MGCPRILRSPDTSSGLTDGRILRAARQRRRENRDTAIVLKTRKMPAHQTRLRITQ